VRSIGDAFCTIGTRLLIVRCNSAHLPRLYSEVTDQRLNPIGKIVDIFGNIESPYSTIVCNDKCRIHTGEKLYMKFEGRKDARSRKSKNAAIRKGSA